MNDELEEDDDCDILDDIKALEDVLAKERTVDKDVSICNLPRRTNFPARGFGELTPQREQEDEDYENEIFVAPRSAYEANERLVQLLKDTRTELTLLLEKCLENLSIINEKIRLHTQSSNHKATINPRIAGIPYFKDAKRFPAPQNLDTIKKSANGEFSTLQLRPVRSWTIKNRDIVWKAILRETADIILREQKSDASATVAPEFVACEMNNTNSTRRHTTNIFKLSKNFKETIGSLSVNDFDWLKIAATDLNNEHTAEECIVLWKVFLQPSITRYKWTKNENSRLLQLIPKFKYQDWDGIAEALGTGRSGYQCFVKFTTSHLIARTESINWTRKEDARLLKCINELSVGNNIPWGFITRYLKGRSKRQVYYRWVYNIAPNLKKGRFTKQEDLMLLDALKKYGTNFKKIARILPHRTSIQLSHHYGTLVQRHRDKQNHWSINQDTKLLKLYFKYGHNWAKIAEEMPDKSRTQLRHRHNSILAFCRKGISLYEMPRQGHPSQIIDGVVDDIETKMVIERLESEKRRKFNTPASSRKIDMELINYFRKMPPLTKPGRKKKYYTPEELKDATAKLSILLEIFNAKLEIPSKFYHRTLTEKDKQLLISLKNYDSINDQLPKSTRRTVVYREIESRNESDEKLTREDEEKHFTPLCSGNCNRKTQLIKLHDSIDYQPAPGLNNCKLELYMHFATPKEVIDLVGIDTNHQFNKLLDIFITRDTTHARKSYEPEEAVSGEFSSNLKTATVRLTTNRKRKRSASESEEPQDDFCQRVTYDESELNEITTFVEPSYHSLLGFQHIISNDCSIFSPETNISMCKNGKGAAAMQLLMSRLIKLFKYPIGFSQVNRPHVNAMENAMRSNESEDVVQHCIFHKTKNKRPSKLLPK